MKILYSNLNYSLLVTKKFQILDFFDKGIHLSRKYCWVIVIFFSFLSVFEVEPLKTAWERRNKDPLIWDSTMACGVFWSEQPGSSSGLFGHFLKLKIILWHRDCCGGREWSWQYTHVLVSRQFLLGMLGHFVDHTVTQYLLWRQRVELTVHSRLYFFGSHTLIPWECSDRSSTVTIAESRGHASVGLWVCDRVSSWPSQWHSIYVCHEVEEGQKKKWRHEGMLGPELTYRWVKRTRERWLSSSWHNVHVRHEVKESQRRK